MCPCQVLIVLVASLSPMDFGQSSGEESVALLISRSRGLGCALLLGGLRCG